MSPHYDMEVKGRKVTIEFNILVPEYDIGIMGYGSEEHILLDRDTEGRLVELENSLTGDEWEQIAITIDANYDFLGHYEE